METADINNPLFAQAINALDEGRLDELQELVNQQPALARDRLIITSEGYFKDPYLIWFVADNPIRIPKLPLNIVEITRFLIEAVKREAPDTYLEQLNYTLELVASGSIPRECGVQIAMLDALMDAGAIPCDCMVAITNSNLEVAAHLIERGRNITLAAALLLDRRVGIDRLMQAAGSDEKLTALAVAAYYGRVDVVKFLLDNGAGPNGYPKPETRFHSHATPLHQAVSAASLDAVKILVKAGARTDLTDTIYGGTPLGWAMHMQTEAAGEDERKAYARIADYLKELS